MSRDMLTDAPCDDQICSWCGADAPKLYDAEQLFGAPDCGEVCELCADARAKELDDDEHGYTQAVHLEEGWR